MKTSHWSQILILFLSVVYLTSAQMPNFLALLDKKQIISEATEVFSNICSTNKIKLDRQKMQQNIENCAGGHLDQIIANARQGTFLEMLMQTAAVLQAPPIKFTADQRSWIKSFVSPACQIRPCFNPLNNSLMEPCLSGNNALSAKNSFKFTTLYLDAICEDDGDLIIELVESVTSDCIKDYGEKFRNCAEKEVNFNLPFNKTAAETCGMIEKLNTCQENSIKGCGNKTNELYQRAFGDVEEWIETCDSGSQSLPVLSLLAIILYVLLGEKIGSHLF